jgi:hypothetical protein
MVVAVIDARRRAGLEMVETEVGDLKYPPAVDETIGWLQIPVRYDGTFVQVDHTLNRHPNTISYTGKCCTGRCRHKICI